MKFKSLKIINVTSKQLTRKINKMIFLVLSLSLCLWLTRKDIIGYFLELPVPMSHMYKRWESRYN